MPVVRVYTTANCPYCRMVKAFLEKHTIPYEGVDVGENKEAAREMVKISGQFGVPVTIVDGEVIIGFDARRLNELFGKAEAGGVYDVMIIGAGPAGLTAAVYCTRKNLRTVVISSNIGGQALESWSIQNYMGFRIVTGEDLMKKFEEQVRELHIHVELDQGTHISQDGNVFTLKTVSDQTFQARSVIITSGRSPRWLGIERERELTGRGISVCATCDGPLFKDKDIAIVGGGNSALTTALELSGLARNVHLIVRGTIRADEIYIDQAKKRGNIIVHLNSEVTRLHGDQILTGITLRDRTTNQEEMLTLEGLFLEIGQVCNTQFLDGFLAINKNQEIIIDCNCHTSRDGVFAAGDVTSVKGKQIIIAAGEGAKAALEAHEYLMRV
jgi:NADH-dependent peroxiredoxin subunit F